MRIDSEILKQRILDIFSEAFAHMQIQKVAAGYARLPSPVKPPPKTLDARILTTPTKQPQPVGTPLKPTPNSKVHLKRVGGIVKRKGGRHRTVFARANPTLWPTLGQHVVHHKTEEHLWRHFDDLFTKEELERPENLVAIPTEFNREIHLKVITPVWAMVEATLPNGITRRHAMLLDRAIAAVVGDCYRAENLPPQPATAAAVADVEQHPLFLH